MPILQFRPCAPLARALALVCVSLGLNGCLPNRVVIDLAPADGKLEESEVLADPKVGGAGPKIALIDVVGMISYEPGGFLIAGGGNPVDDLTARLDKARRDSSVKAVILRINSPGGTVAATETMYREVRRFREETGKPVVVAMAEVAASGGYYLSLAGDRIIAQVSSVTGSIGVIIQTVNLSKGMAMIGVEARAVTSGPNKDIANPLNATKEEHYRLLQGLVDDFYEGFRGRVVERRPGIPADRIPALADGRVFSGRQALAAGLVDETGDIHDAFNAAKRLASLTKARLVKYHSDGRTPSTPYANASASTLNQPAGATGEMGGLHINLNAGGGLTPRAGFYYLWLPPAP